MATGSDMQSALGLVFFFILVLPPYLVESKALICLVLHLNLGTRLYCSFSQSQMVQIGVLVDLMA